MLKFIHPLTVTLAMQLEPVLSSAIGWGMGVVAPPKALTWLGGAVVLVATWLVIRAEEARKREEDAAARAGGRGGDAGEDGGRGLRGDAAERAGAPDVASVMSGESSAVDIAGMRSGWEGGKRRAGERAVTGGIGVEPATSAAADEPPG